CSIQGEAGRRRVDVDAGAWVVTLRCGGEDSVLVWDFGKEQVGRLAIAAQDEDAASEDGEAGYCKQFNSVAVSLLDGERGSLHAVSALCAALCAGDACGDGKNGEEAEAPLHWKNSRRMKRKIQRAPMACQYQTVVS